jgi:hypothetical protein
MQSWEKERQISKESPSSPILPNRNVPPQSSPHDLMAKSNFPPDFKKKYEQWQKIKDEPTASGGAAANIQAGPSTMFYFVCCHGSMHTRPPRTPRINGLKS